MMSRSYTASVGSGRLVPAGRADKNWLEEVRKDRQLKRAGLRPSAVENASKDYPVKGEMRISISNMVNCAKIPSAG